jgi:ABC-2 type transport system ATP-binding protein
MDTFVIETSGLTRRYKDIVAVEDLHLEVPQGCVYGFLGPNGAARRPPSACC